MAFDLSPIIEQQHSAVHSWMVETIAFSILSNGQELEEGAAEEVVQEQILKPLGPCEIPTRKLTQQTIQVANSLLAEVENHDHTQVDQDPMIAVNGWMMRTLAMVHVANQRPFRGETLELEAALKIVDPVQGNRKKRARRADLDRLVRKTIEYAGEQLV